MPHLSPLNWCTTALSLWLILLLLMSYIWWLQLPAFPAILPSNPSRPTPPWYWK